jgi:hypothetical protein
MARCKQYGRRAATYCGRSAAIPLPLAPCVRPWVGWAGAPVSKIRSRSVSATRPLVLRPGMQPGSRCWVSDPACGRWNSANGVGQQVVPLCRFSASKTGVRAVTLIPSSAPLELLTLDLGADSEQVGRVRRNWRASKAALLKRRRS